MNTNEKPIIDEAEVINLADIIENNFTTQDKNKQEAEELLSQIKGEEPKKPDFFNLEKDSEKEKEESSKEIIKENEKEEPVADIFSPTKVDEDPKESLQYKRTLRRLYGEKVNTVIEEDEEGVETETLLDDLLITEEIFDQIVDYQESSKKEDLLKDKISVKGVSNFAQEMLEIDRMGGDITQLLKTKEKISDPLLELDLTEEEDQEKAIFLLESARNTPTNRISTIIRILKEEGSLEAEALEAKRILTDAIQQQIDKQKEVSKKEQDTKEESLKFYKKAIKEEFDKVEIDEARKNKMIVQSTKKTENGRFEIDGRYAEIRNNPEESMWLSIFLEDRQLYNKIVSQKAVVETKLKTAATIRTASRSITSTTLDQQRNNKNGETIDLTKI